MLVRQRAARLGAVGAAWLADLEELVAQLERQWSIQVGPPLPGGSAAYVARARSANGREVLLELEPPDPGPALSGLRRATGDPATPLISNEDLTAEPLVTRVLQ